jgi:hypothetical protein
MTGKEETTHKPSIMSSISNIIATTVSRKFSLNDTVNNSIFAVIFAGMTWATSVSARSVLSRFSSRKGFNPRRLLRSSKYKSCEIRDDMMVSKFLEYMVCNREFYNYSHDLVVGDMQIQFDQMRDPIPFNDKNFGVSGKILFFEVKDIKINQVESDKSSEDMPALEDPNGQVQQPKKDIVEKSTPIETSHIYISLYDCVCDDLSDYIKHVIQHEVLKTQGPIKTMRYKISGSYYNKMIKYINTNKSFYYPDQTTINDNHTEIFFEPNKTILFNDTQFGMRGYINWLGDTITLSHCDLSTSEHGDRPYTVKNYIDDIMNHVALLEKAENKLTLYNVFMLNKSVTTELMYDNIDRSPDVLENLFIKTLFHKDIESLWKQIEEINYHPNRYYQKTGSTPRMNRLLYGPPGTGKSTFAYRVAMATKRHIINIRLNNFSKKELIKVFREPVINGLVYRPCDVIYVLDEFDTDIESILVKSACKEKQMGQIERTVNSFFRNMIGSRESSPSPSHDSPVDELEDMTEKPKVPSKKLSESPRFDRDEVTDVSNKISKIGEYLDTMTETYDKINDIGADIIRIEDLLTIFQGATPIEGCIIIAMTNKYEELRAKCPALFRHGRLTPTYFGHFDIDMLNKVSLHYFGKGFTTTVEQNTLIKIPPSHVMEIINCAMLHDKDKYEYFLDTIRREAEIELEPISEQQTLPFSEIHQISDFTLFGQSATPRITMSKCDKKVTIHAHNYNGVYAVCRCYHKNEKELENLKKYIHYEPNISTPSHCADIGKSRIGSGTYVINTDVLRSNIPEPELVPRTESCPVYKFVIDPQKVNQQYNMEQNMQQALQQSGIQIRQIPISTCWPPASMGALTVNGGIGIAKDLYVGGSGKQYSNQNGQYRRVSVIKCDM